MESERDEYFTSSMFTNAENMLFQLKSENVNFHIQVLDEKFDNDDNPYIKIKLHRYSNLNQEDPFLPPLKEPKDIVIPMVVCNHNDSQHVWYNKRKKYCP